ncbi:uncharacterized protein LOC124615402 [Schistocerca americana]|uniref:uncharacterized protein LOC124615402 n=1 Tax=Schistocerca americana TaxID=7009 RepID=UPI001F4FBF5E|nr:uncharacterized protein LOC124615402 [Schistocerca americana]XP_049830510.1 uncharacterized protein LOC126272039 [Schistocerca gregaria]
MQPEPGPGRYINSVSDLYGTDEIEVLLEEIRELEPTSYRPDEIQDFEIAGSRTGTGFGSAVPMDGGGGDDDDCGSPISGTVHSWDSHANYRHQLPRSTPSASLFSGVVLYCDETHLKSSTGVVRVLLVISSVACLACLCSSGTVKVGLFMLPLIGRLRLMMFVTVFSLLVTCLFIFLDISHIVYFFPFNWGKVNGFFYVSVSVLYLISSSLIIHLIHVYHESYSWVPKWTREQLLIAGALGYVCALEALFLSIITRCRSPPYRPVDEDPSQVTALQERPTSPARLVPSPPPSPHWAEPSTSGLPGPSPAPVDDDRVRPCSSKYLDMYSVTR